ncbi:MAG: N-acetylglucosamine-6-phosphate deacetylase [Anaerolineae bacterium]|nr:N-acetylglucosamine-6-phosphate deacetylase [Candidatus Roseilinea sp.]MDW8450800.1 N-acetylglucosamine-6-phosphate deacetylase [Anaerolineae bacterium]
MRMLIDCGTLALHDRIERHRRVLIEDGVIRAIAAHLDAPADATVIDARAHIVLPGFIDIHVHGAVDADTMDATPEALLAMARFFAAHGVTGFLPTTMTAPREHIEAAIENVKQAMVQPPAPDAARVLGVHLEGPFINPKQCGAQPAEFMRPANPHEYRPWLESGAVKLITVAPEVDGAMRLIEDAQRFGVAVAIGHTDATYDQAQAAFAAGANQATHTFNAMRGLHHREPGALGAVMANDAVYGQLICDNVHVHPAAMNILHKCKGADRLAVITDAMEATGLGDGEFTLGAQRVFVWEGVARLEGGALAGSTLTMDAAFRNIIAATGCSLAEASRMCSATPARAVGLDDRKGRIAPGYDADIVILDADLRVVKTIVGGVSE